jgi:two-component system, OmpR family, sensor histidine kinase CiaH
MFTATRLRLTGWYLVILGAIIGILSAMLYHLVLAAQHAELNGVGVRVRESIADIFAHDQLSLLYQIVTMDIGLVGLSAVGAYFLAGRFLRPLEDAMKRQRRFATSASHDLRTPLTALQGNLGVALLSPRTGGQYREVIRQAVEDSQEMGRMVRGLLLLARDDRGVGPSRFRLVDAGEAVTSAANDIRTRAEEKAQRLETCCAPDLRVRGDRTQLREVLLNLLDNSISFTPEGGTITLSCRREGGNVVIEVEDTGVGISRKHLPHLKEPFYRVRENAGDRTHVGLGLALAQSIVDTHGGKLTIHSRPGVGTSARLSFPLARTRKLRKHNIPRPLRRWLSV